MFATISFAVEKATQLIGATDVDYYRSDKPVRFVTQIFGTVRLYELKLNVPSKDWYSTNGSEVELMLPRLTKKFVYGRVKSCVNLKCTINFNYPENGLRGQNAKVLWPYFPKNIIKINPKFIVSSDGLERVVYLLRDGTVVKREVELAEVEHPYGLVVKGMSKEDMIITFPLDRIFDGQQVEVMK